MVHQDTNRQKVNGKAVEAQRRSTRTRVQPQIYNDFVLNIPIKGSKKDNDSFTSFMKTNIECRIMYSKVYVASLNNVYKLKSQIVASKLHKTLDGGRQWIQNWRPWKQTKRWRWLFYLKDTRPLTRFGCIGLFRLGSVERLISRLIARKYRLVQDRDYKHTLSPVAKFITIRSLIALATIKGSTLHHLDMNNAIFMVF